MQSEIQQEIQVTLTDHFLENGILQVDYEARSFFSFLRDLGTAEMVISERIFEATYRKDNAFLLCVELKDLCQKLGFEPGASLRLMRMRNDLRRIYVELPVNPDRLKDVVRELFASESGPELDQSYQHTTEENLQKLVSDLQKQTTSDSIDQKWAIGALKEYALQSFLEGSELLGVQGLDDVEHFPHQTRVVRKVLFECRGRALLADEVGLGKTIEAGMILREYLLRGQLNSCLILTPASLTMQWRQEMWSKFKIRFSIASSLSSAGDDKFLIMSLDTAKTKTFRSTLHRRRFDMIIVDESHRLKNRKTQNFQFVKGLTSRFLLLLTATPIQNDLIELYNLIYLVAPGVLGTRRQFRKRYMNPSGGRMPVNVKTLRSNLAKAMIRSSRAKSRLNLPQRRVILREVEPLEEELKIYHSLSSLLQRYYPRSADPGSLLNPLTLMLLQKLACSSPQALAGSLEGLLSRGDFPADVVDLFESIQELCVGASKSRKFRELKDLLESRQDDEKILIFTQFRGTQEALRKMIEGMGLETALFHGEMSSKKKSEAVERFRGSAPVLLSTDSGAEGWNLQFARILVNFDLPWNPMKVEQRIGRVHRLGQTREVLIINLYLKGTIEEYIIRLLGQKIKLFERVVGELEMVLGYLGHELKDLETLDRKIMDIIVKFDSENNLQEGFEELGNKFSEAGENYDKVRDYQQLALGTEEL
jgi:SNF2 family DNA or RNA helicase